MADNTMERLRDMLCREVEKIVDSRSELDSNSLIQVDKLTHSIKSIDTILAMQDSGYSQYGGSYYDGSDNSYARGRYAKRDSRGRYSRDYIRRGYSRDEGKEEMMEQLREMLEDAPDERTRMAIQKTITEMQK